MKKEYNEKGNKTLYFILTLSIVFVVIVVFLNYKYIQGDQNRGTFGDMFGFSNALFTGFAFAGIIITILLQRNQLKIQSIELADTRKEFEIQNNTLKFHRFENTFFNMLS